MGKKFDDIEEFENQEIELEHEGKSYVWRGSYSIRTWGENPDWDYPGDSESELASIETDSFEMYLEDKDTWIDAELTKELLQAVIDQIEI